MRSRIIVGTFLAGIVLYNKQKKIVGMAVIDLKNLERVRSIKWHMNNTGHVVSTKVGLLHRFLTGCPPDKIVDHENGKKWDNREDNLRICTIQNNSCNRKISLDNKSGTTGVYWRPKTKKWAACIKINYKGINLGSYEYLIDAIKARKDAEVKYFGEFAHKIS